jgi:hypothetical protein
VEDSSGIVEHASCPWCGGALRDDPAGPATTADAVQVLWSFDPEAPYRGEGARRDILDLCPGLTSAARDVARAGEAGALPHLRPGGDPQAATRALVAAGWGRAEADALVGAYLSLWPDGTNPGHQGDVGIAEVSAGDGFTVGLLKDGSVVATGSNRYGRCDVSGWRDVAEVSAGPCHTVSLLRDGTVVATGMGAIGWDDYGRHDVSGWKDVAAVSAGAYHTVGLLKDGTVVATGLGDYEGGACDVSGWHDVAAVSAGAYHTVGLLKDGTVVATGDNREGQCNVSDW